MKTTIQIQELKDLSNEQLVDRFQTRGDMALAAYAELIQRHQADLFRRCHARLGNWADAEEAVQESLWRAYRGLPRFRGDAGFRTWLFSIGDNQCNTLHARRSRQMMGEHMRALIALQEELRAPVDDLDDDALVRRVRDVLAGLPNPAREVLILRFYRELGLEEIATTLGIGLSAAKMRLYRAIRQFDTRFQTETVGAG